MKKLQKTDYNLYTSGITVYTNYDPNAQQILYDVANTNDYVNFPPNDEIQTAASLIDSTTGKITALIGGRHQEGQLSETEHWNATRYWIHNKTIDRLRSCN